MLSFNKENTRLGVDIDNWKDAVTYSANLLVEQGCAEKSYIDGILEGIKEFGSYIVISDNLAIPHARPEKGSKKIGFSLVTLNNPVYFDDSDNPVRVFIAFTAIDNSSHIEILQNIVKIVENNLIEKIIEAKNIDDLNKIMREI